MRRSGDSIDVEFDLADSQVGGSLGRASSGSIADVIEATEAFDLAELERRSAEYRAAAPAPFGHGEEDEPSFVRDAALEEYTGELEALVDPDATRSRTEYQRVTRTGPPPPPPPRTRRTPDDAALETSQTLDPARAHAWARDFAMGTDSGPSLGPTAEAEDAHLRGARAAVDPDLIGDETPSVGVGEVAMAAGGWAPPPHSVEAATSMSEPPARFDAHLDVGDDPPTEDGDDAEEASVIESVSLEADAFDEARAAELEAAAAYDELYDLYMQGGDAASDRATGAALFMRAGRLAEQSLSDWDRAFAAYFAAVETSPDEDEAQLGLERAGHGLGALSLSRWKDAIRRMQAVADATQEPAMRASYLGLLARWHVFELKRRDVATEYFATLSKLDPAHPVMLERRANESRAAGDILGQKKNLLRALERATRIDDRRRILLGLAELHEGPLDQKKTAAEYYETALRENPELLEAVQGLERLARARGDGSLVIQSLERELTLAKNPKREREIRFKLASEHEAHGDAQRAVELAESLLDVDALRPKAFHLMERAKRRLGDHVGAAQAMIGRAAATASLKTKTDLLMAAAEELEAHADDLTLVVEALRQVTLADDRHRGALISLRRLAHAQGDLRAAVEWGVRLSERTRDKREAAQLCLELGHELLQHLHDVSAAKEQFERAQAFDKKSVLPLVALENLARDEGNFEIADELAFRRAQLTTDAKEASVLFLERAKERARMGNGEAGLIALHEAHKRDPKNAEALGLLLDLSLREQRYREAEALCEEAIVLAERGKRPDEAALRRRQLTQITVALGDPKKALQAALYAFQSAPNDVATRDDLLRIAADAPADVLVMARADLGRIADQARALPAPSLMLLARALVSVGEMAKGRSVVDRVLHQRADDVDALELYEQICLSEKAWREAANTKMHLARVLPSEELRFKKLTQAGDIYARRENDLPNAIAAFEAARAIKADDPWLRETLGWAYEEAQDWPKLARMLREEIDRTPVDKRVPLLQELAQLFESRLKDTRGLLGTLDELLDLNPDALAAFEQTVRVLTTLRDYPALERAYRKMLSRLRGRGKALLEKELFKQLGLIYRDRLRDNDSAISALGAARNIDPADIELLRMLRELTVLSGRDDDTIRLTRELVRKDALDPALYHGLYEIFLRRAEFDKAWNALDVVAQLEPLSDDKLVYYNDYPPYPTSTVPGTLTEDAWRSHILHPDLDPTLTVLLRHLVDAALAEQMRPEPEPIALSAHQTPFADAVHAAIMDGAEIFGVTPPPLFVGQAATVFSPRRMPPGLSVSPGPLNRAGDSLLFQVGFALAAQRPEFRPLTFFGTIAELTALVARAAQRDARLFAMMPPQAADEVRRILEDVAARGVKVDVRRWLFLAHASCARAALLLCGTANGAAIFYSDQVDDPQATDKLGELYAFAVSDQCSELRAAIGVAVGAS